MRFLAVCTLSLAFGFTFFSVDKNIGISVMFLSIFFLGMLPVPVKVFRFRYFFSMVSNWSENINGCGNPPTPLYFSKGALKWKSSDVQLIFCLYSEKKELWFLCGSWWFGCLSNEFKVFERDDDGKIKQIALIKGSE